MVLTLRGILTTGNGTSTVPIEIFLKELKNLLNAPPVNGLKNGLVVPVVVVVVPVVNALVVLVVPVPPVVNPLVSVPEVVELESVLSELPIFNKLLIFGNNGKSLLGVDGKLGGLGGRGGARGANPSVSVSW